MLDFDEGSRGTTTGPSGLTRSTQTGRRVETRLVAPMDHATRPNASPGTCGCVSVMNCRGREVSVIDQDSGQGRPRIDPPESDLDQRSAIGPRGGPRGKRGASRHDMLGPHRGRQRAGRSGVAHQDGAPRSNTADRGSGRGHEPMITDRSDHAPSPSVRPAHKPLTADSTPGDSRQSRPARTLRRSNLGTGAPKPALIWPPGHPAIGTCRPHWYQPADQR